MNVRDQHGFTLIELMIAMVLGLFLAGGVVTLFVHSRQSFSLDENVARMQEEARFALHEIARDLRMASYLAEPLVPGALFQDATLDVATDCGPVAVPNWVYRMVTAGAGDIDTVESVDNADGATASASFSCIGAGEIREDTDVIAIKRVAGDPLPDAALVNGDVYLRSNGTVGFLYVEPPAMVVAGPWNNWEFRPHIYYIRSYATTPGDGIPSLCRKVLVGGAPPTMTTECIAQGVEDLQIEYGLDTDNDGSPNQYLSDPTLAELQNLVSARVYLLARTREQDRRYTDERTYTISNAPAYTPGDNFHRRLYTTTVTVHNLRNLRRLGI